MLQNKKIFYSLLGLIFFIILQEKCDAIKCWVCRSDVDRNCGDPFDNSTLPITDCNFERLITNPDLKATMCRTIKQKVNGEWSYFRNCAFLGNDDSTEKNFCKNRTSSSGIEMEYCNCNDRDGCNSG